jgi:hypothetical protein
LYKQRQQIENTTSDLSETTNKVANSVIEYQQTNTMILDKNIDTSNKYRINIIQLITNNTIELQELC